jgi:hypothetical protein
MTYKKNFVAAIKVNGQILRESSDRVELPFGSEYSILLKNLDTVRMQARISIDGKPATSWLVLGPRQDIEVERFVEDLNSGNRFKFIERTERVEQHRGIGVEDGLVRIEFKREKVYPINYSYNYNYNYNYSNLNQHALYSSPVYNTSAGSVGALRGANLCSAQSTVSAVQNDTGITVQGSLSDQKFVLVSNFQTEPEEVVILHLVGKTADKIVKVAKTVKRKIECDTCGKKNKSSAKFCIECGTGLERI